MAEDAHAQKVAILRDFFEAGNAGDFDTAATLFEEAYDVCAAAKSGEYAAPAEAGPMDLGAVLGKG